MADDHLVGNLNTFALISYCEKNGIEHGLNIALLNQARQQLEEGIIGRRA